VYVNAALHAQDQKNIMGKSSASVRSSLSKASKKEKKEKKEKKKSKKLSSSASTSAIPSSASRGIDAPESLLLATSRPSSSSSRGASSSVVPKHVEFDEESIRQTSSSSHDEDDPDVLTPSPPASPPKARSNTARSAASPVKEDEEEESQPAAIASKAANTKHSKSGRAVVTPVPSFSDVTPRHGNHQGSTGASSNLPVPQQVSFEGGVSAAGAAASSSAAAARDPADDFNDSANLLNHSTSSSNNSTGGHVSFAPDVSSTTFEGDEYEDYARGEDDDEDDQSETEAYEALPTLVTHTLWNTESMQAVSAGLVDLIESLTEDEANLEADELDPRHEALLLGGHLTLIRVVQNYMQCSDVVMDAFQALLIMFDNVNVYWLGVLGSMGAMEAVVSTLMVKASDLVVQEQAYKFLTSLLRHKGNAIKFLHLDGLSAMFRRLDAYPEDRETNLDVCRVIKALCVWEDTRSVLVSSGAVRTLAGVIDRCSGSGGGGGGAGGSDYTSITSATTSHTAESPTSSITADGASVASSIYQDPVVQRSARDTMVALVGAEQTSPRRGSRRHKGGDGVSTASSKKSKHSKKKRSSKKSSSSRCESVPEDELLPAASEDYDPAYASPQPYQSYETMMIRDLWSDCDEVVLTALQEISDVLSQNEHMYGKAFIEVGGPLAVTKVMEMRRSPQVQQAGCKILSTLVSLDGFPTILGEVGGVETLLERIRDASTSKLKKDAIKALGKMLKGSPQPNTQRLVAAGGVAVLVHVMHENEESAHLQHEGCKVFKQVCGTDPAYPPMLIRSGVASAVARVLELHADDKKTLKAAKKAMKALLD
jgi:hypothetical protein